MPPRDLRASWEGLTDRRGQQELAVHGGRGGHEQQGRLRDEGAHGAHQQDGRLTQYKSGHVPPVKNEAVPVRVLDWETNGGTTGAINY